MRNRIERFTSALVDYLKSAISARVASINADDPDISLPDIALWQTGYNGVLAGLSHYPGCIVLVNGRTLVDPYTTSYSVVIGIGLTADDPDYLEKMGRAYEDILEDCIRSDWSLGGSALDTDIGVQFQSDNVSNVYLIQAQLTCQVDLGGYVYDENDREAGNEDNGKILPVSEMPGDSGAIPEGEGDGILPTLRDADDADNEGVGTEEASIQLEAEEEK